MQTHTASHRRRILFAKLGSFSHTNERLLEQLSTFYPQHEIVVFDVKDYIKRQYGAAALNACLELAMFGPAVFSNPTDRHAFFFLTPFMFRRLSDSIGAHFANQAQSFDFTMQTQGLFNAALPGRPFVIYTDYTLHSGLDDAAHDPRLLRSARFHVLEKALYRRADQILVTAGHVKQTLIQHYGCDGSRITPILIGANVAAVPTSLAPDRYAAGRILFIGIDWQRKGGANLMRAFEMIADRFPHATLTIAGCAPASSHPRIQALGLLPRTEIARLLAEASIFCLPSRIEPSAVASVEAMAFHLPVVATTVGGFPEMVKHEETGLLVPPDDPDALAQALASLLADPDRARAMGAAGFARSKQFTWDAVGARLHQHTENYTRPVADAAPLSA